MQCQVVCSTVVHLASLYSCRTSGKGSSRCPWLEALWLSRPDQGHLENEMKNIFFFWRSVRLIAYSAVRMRRIDKESSLEAVKDYPWVVCQCVYNVETQYRKT